jgi:hypothetical protein
LWRSVESDGGGGGDAEVLKVMGVGVVMQPVSQLRLCLEIVNVSTIIVRSIFTLEARIVHQMPMGQAES